VGGSRSRADSTAGSSTTRGRFAHVQVLQAPEAAPLAEWASPEVEPDQARELRARARLRLALSAAVRAGDQAAAERVRAMLADLPDDGLDDPVSAPPRRLALPARLALPSAARVRAALAAPLDWYTARLHSTSGGRR
jgi:hypothetical protein